MVSNVWALRCGLQGVGSKQAHTPVQQISHTTAAYPTHRRSKRKLPVRTKVKSPLLPELSGCPPLDRHLRQTRPDKRYPHSISYLRLAFGSVGPPVYTSAANLGGPASHPTAGYLGPASSPPPFPSPLARRSTAGEVANRNRRRAAGLGSSLWANASRRRRRLPARRLRRLH